MDGIESAGIRMCHDRHVVSIIIIINSIICWNNEYHFMDYGKIEWFDMR